VGLGLQQSVSGDWSWTDKEHGRLLRCNHPNVLAGGFSRGAYTVRCLAGVLALCGVPTQENGQDLKGDPVTARRIASEAVESVYQYTSSIKEVDATPEQKLLLDETGRISETIPRKIFEQQ
jgi:hypothetical protein